MTYDEADKLDRWSQLGTVTIDGTRAALWASKCGRKAVHSCTHTKHLVGNLLLTMTVLPCLLRVSSMVVPHARYSLLDACQRVLHLLHAPLPCLHPSVQATIAHYLLKLKFVPAQTTTSHTTTLHTSTLLRLSHSGFCGLFSSACCHMWSSTSTGRKSFGVCASSCTAGWPLSAFRSWHSLREIG